MNRIHGILKRAAAPAVVALAATTALASSGNPKHFVEPNAVPVFGDQNYLVTFDGGGSIVDYGSRDVDGSVSLWSVAANYTTKQEWTNMDDNRVVGTDDSVNTDPGTGFIHGAGTFTTPRLTVHAPGYISLTNNFYSFENDYGAHAVVSSYGGATGTLNGGTLVLMQTAAGINPDYRPVYNVGDITAPATGDNLGEINAGALTITKADGSALPAAPQTLLFDKNFQVAETPTSFGNLPYQELIWGVWVPGWTGDIKVDFEMPVHSMLSSIRFDTGVGSMSGTPSLQNFTLGPPPVAAILYWDMNGPGTGGAGGTAPSGTWDAVTPRFNSDAAGGNAGTLTASVGAVDTVVFSAGADATGNYTVTLTGPRSAAQVSFEEGNVTLTGGALATGVLSASAGAHGTIASPLSGGPTGAVLKQGAGTVTLTGSNAYTGGTTVQAGTLQVNRLHENNAVTITGGTLRVLESSPDLASGLPSGNNASVSRLSSLTVAAGGTLDLANNDLIIDYSNPGASPAAAIEALIASGYGPLGNWFGTGITSSVAQQDGNFALAIADNQLLNTAYTTFSGQSVDPTTVLVKFTWVDDIDLDGKVTTNDAITFGNNYSLGDPATRTTGDMDYDGVFTTNDAIVFGNNYDTSLPGLPEPGSLAVLGLLGIGLARQRRST